MGRPGGRRHVAGVRPPGDRPARPGTAGPIDMTPRLLITGGTGFVGCPCVRRAIATGAEVHVVARTSPGLPVESRFHPADLFDTDRVSAVVAAVKPTHLLHLAWVATPGTYWTSP